MSTFETITPRAFYRSADNAMLGGVCAGIAGYFGFNLRATRFLAICAFVMAMPMTVMVYLAIVFLVPARTTGKQQRVHPKCWRTRRAKPEQMPKQTPQQTAIDVRDRTKSLDRRLAKLERYITSSRYQLDKEFRDLEASDRQQGTEQ